jgi:ABC-type Na+ efflux pump permease subunit
MEQNHLHFFNNFFSGGKMDPLNTGFTTNYKPMTMGDWLITFLIQAIPLVGIIMLFVWAFGDGTHPSKKTWAQASLVFALIMFILVIIFIAALWTMFSSFFSGAYNIQSV